MLSLTLSSLESTQLLGKWLGTALPHSGVEAIYLYGPLGCGKTTLTQALVKTLAGGENAEIASPSFTIFHCYPTQPVTIHCDLYRCQQDLPEELLELFDAKETLAIVEWAEFLPSLYRAGTCLDIYMKACEKHREIKIQAVGIQARKLCDNLASWCRTNNNGLITSNEFLKP